MRRKHPLPHFHDGRAFPTPHPILSGHAVPPSMRESRAIIGGVGKTLRWSFSTGAYKADRSGVGDVRGVDGVEKRAALFELISTVDGATMAPDGESVHVEHAWRCVDVAVLVSHSLGLRATVRPLPHVRDMCVGVDRMDGAEFKFWNQTDATACPKQSAYKWVLAWMPEHWRVLPFTWTRLAQNLDEPLEDLELPLRHHVARARVDELGAAIADADDDDELATYLRAKRDRAERALPDRPYVTCALTDEQTRQLLATHFVLRFLPHDEALVAAASELSVRYVRHGFSASLCGPYRQSAEFVGHGNGCREFRHLAQYEVANLPLPVLNRVYQPDGSVKGRGRRRSRSKAAGLQKREMRNDARYATDVRRLPASLLPAPPLPAPPLAAADQIPSAKRERHSSPCPLTAHATT